MKKIIIYTLLIMSILTGCGSTSVTDSEEKILEPITHEEVDPDVVEYLDTFKESVDSYIKFLELYYSAPEELQLEYIGDFAKCANIYNEDCSKVNNAYQQLDEKNLLSDADKAYWIEVYTDCTMRVLEVLGDATESE